MMCWVALDRLLKLARMGKVRIPVEKFERERNAIEDTVERRGFNVDLNSYVSELDGNLPDASLILAARCGYRPADHPRMQGTYDFIDRLLGVNGMLYRYVPADVTMTPMASSRIDGTTDAHPYEGCGKDQGLPAELAIRKT